MTSRIVGLLSLALAAPLLAQDPPTPPIPAPAAAPAPVALPATPTPPAWAQMSLPQGARRGWFGVQLSCEDCFIQRGPGRVAYVRRPAVNWVDNNGPAYAAGIRSGDTIATVDGMDITTPEGFERFATAMPGQSVRLGLRRNGEREITIVPANNTSMTSAAEYYNSRLRTAQRNGFQALRSAFRQPMGWLGLSLECEQCAENSRRWTFRRAAAVKMVDVDGPANRAGLRRGDTLTAIDGMELTTTEGGRAFSAIEPGQRITLTVRRDGRERRVPIVAASNPDATREEVAAFEEYRRTRDSSEAIYREVLSASVTRAQAELIDLQRMLREVEANRTSVEDSRRRLATVDSVLRALRSLERQRASDGGLFSYTTLPSTIYPTVIVPGGVSVASPMAIRNGMVYPLRYSSRLGDVVNVEARSASGVNASEVGDSLIVLTGAGFEVKVQMRPAARR